jgi:hypothetical protein
MNTKLELIHLCEVGSASKSKITLYGLTYSVLFNILRSRGDWLCDGRPVTQNEMHSAENED